MFRTFGISYDNLANIWSHQTPRDLCFQNYPLLFQTNFFRNVLFQNELACQEQLMAAGTSKMCHDDVMKWKHFPRYWPFVRDIHRSPVNSPHKRQWCGALVFLSSAPWINGWVNDREAGDLRRYRAHYDITIM